MRLFIAIDLPDDVKEYLRKLQTLLSEGKMSLTRDFHLTLKFLGSCDEGQRKKIKDQLREISFAPFEAELEHMGTFGGRVPRVVWVGVKVAPSLSRTVHEIERRMETLGFLKEHPWTPHITLARIKFIPRPQEFLANLKAMEVQPLRFPVSEFHLFESQLLPEGAKHVKLATFSGQQTEESRL